MEGTSQASSGSGRLSRCSMDQLYAELGTGPEGLSSAEADRRQAEHGPNILPERPAPSLSRKVIAQLRNLFNILLVFAAALSFVAGVTSSDVSSIEMGVAILLVVAASILFSIFQEFRAEKAVEALRQLVPEEAKVLRNNKTTKIPVSRIVPGDVVILEEGDRVPADARLVTAFEITIDNSVLTGESEPQPRGLTCTNPAECPLEEATNMVLAGTTVASGSGSAVVLATGKDTRFGQVVGIAQEIEEPLSPLQKEINHTAKLGFVAAISIGLLFLIVALQFLHLNIPDSLLFMIGVMVALVPEGLQITLTLALAFSSLAMSKRNVVVKRLSSVETLGSTTVICTDKTGTITEGQMTVRKVWLGGRTLDVSGEGYEPEGEILLDGKEVRASDVSDLRLLCEIAALDNRATLVPPLDRRKYRWTAVGDSTDAAVLVLAAKAGIDSRRLLEERPRVGMVPFDSIRKMMTSVHRQGDTTTAYVKGAGSEILRRCSAALWNGHDIPMTAELSKRIGDEVDALASEAYRVIAFAIRKLPEPISHYDSATVETELTFVGLVAILDPPRRDAAQAVQKARSAGIKIVMLTGDHELTAEAIARSVGIITSSNYSVTSSEKLSEKSDKEVLGLLSSPELVFARITPEQKLRIVRLLKQKGETVAVTGDGVNDAPALLEADIGISMGITGTDVARESSDMVLLDDDFASIVGGIEVGRSVFDNLRKFMVYVYGHNWAELMTFLVFVLLQTPLPLAVVGVLAIDLVLEIPPSIALTMEPPEPGIMDRPPRSRSIRLFDARTLARSCYIGTLVGLVAVAWCFDTWAGAGWSLGMTSVASREEYLRGTTVVLVGIMAGQLGNFFATRTNITSAFRIGISRNRWLLPSLAIELALLLAIVYVPFIQPIFETAGLEPLEWLYLFSFAPVIFLLEELRKLILRASLPVAPLPLPIPIPLAHVATKALATARRPRAPFVQVGPPVVVMGISPAAAEDAIPVAVSVAEQSGSKIVIASDLEPSLRMRDDLASETNIPSEFVPLKLGRRGKRAEAGARAVREYAERNGSEMIVLPVGREVLSGRVSRRAVRPIEQFSGKRVVLVSGPASDQVAAERPRRLLIPVLEEFSPEVFALAGALTASARVPDVDVVAAKVIRMPPTIPLYSTYRPESLVDSEEELSFLRSIRGLPLLRRLTPRVLLVRDISRDLVEFAEQRRVDMIILKGDWSLSGRGFLGKIERKIATRATCQVVVLLPAAH